MKIILLALTSAIMIAQSPGLSTPVVISNGSGSATGELRMVERRINGFDYVGIKSPQSVPSSITFSLPGSDGAMGQCLKTDGSLNLGWAACSGSGGTTIASYVWSRTNGTDASGSLGTAGVVTITLTPCPVGVDATDTANWAYISGGTGAAEAAQYTTSGGAGTCTSGAASGTIKVTTANTHTGAWVIANAGFREAVNVASAGDTLIGAAMSIYAPTVIDKAISIDCGSAFGSGGPCTLTAYGDFVVIDVDQYAGVSLRNFAIVSNSAQSSGAGIRLGVSGSTNHNCSSRIENVTIHQAYYGIHIKDGCKPILTMNEISDSTKYGIYVQNVYAPDAGDGAITLNTISNNVSADAAIRIESGGGLRVENNKILGGASGYFPWGIDLYATPATPTTGYLQIIGNNIDRVNDGGIRLGGLYSFGYILIQSNIVTALGGSSACVQTNDTVTIIGIYGNICTSTVGLDANTGTNIQMDGSNWFSGTSVSASVEVAVGLPVSVTYANLPSDATDGSVMYCSNCNSTCTAGGSTGAYVKRLNNSWKCDSGSFFAQGGNSFGTTATLGTNDNQDLYFERNNTVVGYFNSSGFGSTGYIQSASGGLDARLQVGCGVAACVGLFSNNDFGFVTDSTVRWRVSSTGMFHPETHATEDIGLTGTRVRSIYAQAGEFYVSGGTSSGDYLETRKYNVRDRTGGASASWRFEADANNAGSSDLEFRDNAGSRAVTMWRVLAGGAVNYAYWYMSLLPALRATADGDAVNDSTMPSIGATGSRWEKVWANDADFADDVNVTDVLTVGGNATLSGSINTMSGTLRPGFDGLGSIGDSSFRYGSIYAYDGNFADDVTISDVLTMSNSTANVTGDLIPTATGSYFLGTSTKLWASIWGTVINAGSGVYPSVDGGADLGSSSLKWANSYFNTINVYSTIIPDTTNARQLGSSTRVWSKTFTNDIRIDGTVTAPNGSSGVSATGGTSCTITAISGGIITAATCI